MILYFTILSVHSMLYLLFCWNVEACVDTLAKVCSINMQFALNFVINQNAGLLLSVVILLLTGTTKTNERYEWLTISAKIYPFKIRMLPRGHTISYILQSERQG